MWKRIGPPDVIVITGGKPNGKGNNTMAALNMGKSRDKDNPYLIITDNRSGFVYRILKAYVRNPDQQFARVFAYVTSPFTFGDGDMGDTYWSDISGEITFRDPVVEDSDLPKHLRAQEPLSRDEKREALMNARSYEEMEDIVGDGDIFDYL